MRCWLCVAVVILFGSSHNLAAAALYQVTDLSISAGSALNSHGDVTGSSADSFHDYAVVDSSGRITNLGTLGGLDSYGRAINDHGQITGLSDTAFGAQHAFLYSEGRMIDLGSFAPAPYSFSEGNAIDDNGQVVGGSETSDGYTHAFLYSNGQIMDLGTLPGRNNSIGSGINSRGEVTGYSFTTAAGPRAFLYSNGRFTDLGTLPGGSWSVAYAINDGGEVTGTAQTSAGEAAIVGHAFIYANGEMVDLGTLGGAYSVGSGINNKGQIVGQADTGSGVFDAFLYSNGEMEDLNDSVDLSATGFGKLYGAEAINDSGQILAGACATPSSCIGLGHTLLLTPVPEPATLALLVTALLLLGAGVRYFSTRERAF